MLLKTIFVHYKMVAIFGILNLMHLDFPFFDTGRMLRLFYFRLKAYYLLVIQFMAPVASSIK